MAKKAKRWTEVEVYDLLKKVFPMPAYTLLPQLRNGVGFVKRPCRTIDAMIVSTWSSHGLWVGGVEIKVSRSDWRRELANPQKADSIQKFCKYWYVASPPDVIPEGEVPETWGLIHTTARRSVTIVRAAPALEPEPLDMPLICSMIRCAAECTAQVNGRELNRKIAEEVEARVEEAAADSKHESERRADELQFTIDRFEKASGVRLGLSWNATQIGEAVKLVRACGIPALLRRSRELRNQHQRISDQLGESISAVEVSQSPQERVTDG